MRQLGAERIEMTNRDDMVDRIVEEMENECDIPPLGWRCTRGKGHAGPCAAVECPEDTELVERGMSRLRETTNAQVQAGRAET